MNDTPLLIDVHSDEWPNDDDDEGAGSSNADDDRPRRYYRDADGKLRARRLWRCYTRARHILALVVPLFKRDSNSFLCAPIVENTLLNLTMLVIRILAVQVVLELTLHDQGGRADDCQYYTRNFLDISSYTLGAVIILCIPTLNVKGCRLHYQSQSDRGKALGSSTSSFATTGDHDEGEDEIDADDKRQKEEDDAKRRRMRKTLLFRICELTVVLEVMYLLATIGLLFTDDSDENVFDLYDACYHVTKHYYVDGGNMTSTSASAGSGSGEYESVQEYLPVGRVLVVVLVQVLAVLAYVLRWRQIVLFHQMHLHFLFQTGIMPARARFDYEDRDDDDGSSNQDEKSRWTAMRKRLAQIGTQLSPSWLIRAKERRRLKMGLYRSAKRGRVEELREFVRLAAAFDGPRFANKWFTQPERPWLPLLFTCKRQHNPLHAAIVFDQPEVVRELISLRADDGERYFDVNALDKMETHRMTLSWLYVVVFRIMAVVLRVAEFRSNSFGAQAMRPFGPAGVFHYTLISPLHVATTLGNADMVRLLLQQGGADPNAVARASSSQHATPPLFWVRNNVECARLLLEADADPLCIPSLRRQGYRSAHGAFSLITAYEVARLSGNGAVARLMEAYGGDVALTPLHDASARGLAKEVDFYLSHGAEPNVLGEQVVGLHGRTPLHWAAIRGQTQALRTLLRFGARVDARDTMGRTPLAWACVLRRAGAVRVLLAHGADPNTRDVNGDPLLCALAAVPERAQTFSVSPLEMCVADARVLSEHHYDHIGQFGGQSHNSQGLESRILKLLVDHGVDLKATRVVNGDSALHVALRRGNERAAVLLVRAGLQLTARNARGERALECTNSATLRYAVKKEAGQRDVMISYTHTHAALATKLRDELERANVTTWIDAMDPTGIPGGADWRREIASGIQQSALVVALLTRDYSKSPWCMKELAFARLHNVPVVGIQCEDVDVVSEELQVYLWTRQLVDFRPGVMKRPREPVNADGHGGAAEVRNPDDNNVNDSGSQEGSALELSADVIENGGHGVAADVGGSDEGKNGPEQNSNSNEEEEEGDDEMELVPDDRQGAFRECMRLLLDGIHDRVEEHRAHLEAQDKNDSPLRQSVLDNAHGEDEQQVLAAASSSLARLVSSSDEKAPLVFIAHGDYHAAFCRRLRVALARRGIHAVDNQNAFVEAADLPSASTQRLRRQSSATGGASSGQVRQIAAKDAILASAAVVAVLSPVTVTCGVLADQLAFAEDRGKLVVPLVLSLHSVDLAHRYSFARSAVHHVNATLGFNDSIVRLANDLRTHIGMLPSVSEEQREERARSSSLSSVSDVVEFNSPSSSPNVLGATNSSERNPGKMQRAGSGGNGHGHGWRLRSENDSNVDQNQNALPLSPPPLAPPPLLQIRSLDGTNNARSSIINYNSNNNNNADGAAGRRRGASG